jgi:hypothetical protein
MYNNPYRLINDMEELYPGFEVPELDLDLPEIDIPELDLGDMELIEDYSLSIGSRAEASLPDKML